MVENIRERLLAARKSRFTVEVDLYTTVLAAVEAAAKNEMRAPEPRDVIAVVQSFIKANRFTVEKMQAAGKTSDRKFDREYTLLKELLPPQMSEDELRKIVTEMIEQLPDRTPKQMGAVMKALKQQHEGMYDPSIASNIVKELLK